MVERDEVVRIAREKLGAMSRGATGEYSMLARELDAGEEIRTMVLAKLDGRTFLSGVIAVATPRRLLFASKSLLTRRERMEAIDAGRITGVRLESPTTIVLDVEGTERRLGFAYPPSQVVELVAWARPDRDSSRYEELSEIARRKLGRFHSVGLEGELVALEATLEEDEAVLDLAYAVFKPSMLIVITSTRVILVPPQGLRKGTPPTCIGYDRMVGVEATEDDLVLETTETTHRLRQVAPDEAAAIVAGRIAARLDAATA